MQGVISKAFSFAGTTRAGGSGSGMPRAGAPGASKRRVFAFLRELVHRKEAA